MLAAEPGGSGAFEGYLWKKGNVNPAFKRRWFRLSAGRLSYFADQWSAHPKGVISLGGARVAALAQAVGRHDHCFLLACAEGAPDSFAGSFSSGRGKEPEYMLAAPSFAERQAWLAELRKWLHAPPDGLTTADSCSDAGAEGARAPAAPPPPLPPLSAAAAAAAADGRPALTMRSPSGRKLLRDLESGAEYELRELLGEGATCKVKRCVHTGTGAQYALKILKKSRLKKRRHFLRRERRHASEYEFALREIAILRSLAHAHVVALHEVFDDEERDRLYMLLEYMPGGQVGPSQQRIEPLPLQQARACVRDVARGLAYLHSRNVLHRDIKPANILRSSGAADARFAIADFGVSLLCADGDDGTTGNVGTLPFKPPEAHDAAGGTFSGKAADVWSLGVSLFQLVYGELPFYAADALDFGASVRDDPLVFPGAPPVDPRLEDLLRRMLTKAPAERLSAAAVLAHPWLRDEAGPGLERAVYSALSATSDDLSRALRSMLSFGRECAGAGGEATASAQPRVRVGVVVSPRRARAAGAGRRASAGAELAGSADDNSGYAESEEGEAEEEEERRGLRAGLGARVRVRISVGPPR